MKHKLLSRPIYWVLFSLVAATLFVSACQLPAQPLGQQVEVTPVEEFVPTLTDMTELTELQSVFNAHPDVPRLILLLSPT